MRFNFEMKQVYSLFITARDDGVPPKSSNAAVTAVQINNLNDNVPVFTPVSYGKARYITYKCAVSFPSFL